MICDTRAGKQWIELYNSTTTSATNPASATVNMGGWFLYFVDAHDKIPTPADATVATFAKVKNVVKLDLVDPDATGAVNEQVHPR